MSLISIVVPVYNAKASLRKCLDSLAQQTYTEFEVLLIDDGSTDESPEICREFSERDSRFRLITQRNAGPAAARNNGMELAAGKYITFVDSDDYVEPQMLEELFRRAEESGADITVFGYYLEKNGESKRMVPVYEPGVYRGDACRKLSLDMIDIHTKANLPPYCWVRFLRRDFLMGLQLRMDPAIYRSEDYLFWTQVHFRAECVCVASDLALYHYIDNAASITHKYVKGYWKMAKAIYSRLYRVLPDEPAVHERLDNMLVHRSLIAFNIASRVPEQEVFRADVDEILHDPDMKRIIDSWPVKTGWDNQKAFYVLMKLRMYPVVRWRYEYKVKKLRNK